MDQVHDCGGARGVDDQDQVRDCSLGVPGGGQGQGHLVRPGRGSGLASSAEGRGGDADPHCRRGRRLVACADSKRVSSRKGFRAYVALCAFAGLRLGEASGVQVGDIDFLRRELKVSRQIQRYGSGYKIAPPKYGSERVVSLPDDPLTMLAEHIATTTPEGELDRWLFTIDGQPMHDNAVTWRWMATRKSAGLPWARLHDLRLLCQRADRRCVQRRDGAAGARAFDGDDNPEHLPAPMANRRGPDPQCGGRPHAGRTDDSCGLPADCGAVNRG